MEIKRNPFIVLLIAGMMGGMFLGCTSVELSKIPKKPLPASPPMLTELTLELPPEGGARQPVDSSLSPALQGNIPNIVIVEKDSSALRTAAEQDPTVKTELGERYGFIAMEEVAANQCRITVQEEGSAPRNASNHPSKQDKVHRLTYYSYTHNSAIHVCLKENNVVSVQRDSRKGYQPEESPEEIEHAIALARQDPRIAQDVRNLFGHAILTSPEEYRYFWVSDEAGFGNRVLWVTFSETAESLALFFARVDLTTDTVLDAGKEPGPQ
ncbi:MAG: hypothetical protein AB7T38_13485 [Nitrospirales bacterium]